LTVVLAALGSAVFWAFILVTSVLLFPVAVLIWLVTRPFDPRTRALHAFTCLWASLYTWLNPVWRVHVTGRQHVRRGETYVMVANHLSLVDILVLFRLFVPFAWVSKEENFSVPFIGWNMRLNGYIPLRRGDKQSAAAMLDACRRTLRGGTSIMMFPEGTRSRTGELQAFRPGAFALASELGLPVLPIVLRGSGDALPTRGWVLRGRHVISVDVLPEVPVPQGADVTALTASVHDLIAQALLRPDAAADSTP
jgi:1-acyl-sn-glycerol-3-phosphate acyltransferase